MRQEPWDRKANRADLWELIRWLRAYADRIGLTSKEIAVIPGVIEDHLGRKIDQFRASPENRASLACIVAEIANQWDTIGIEEFLNAANFQKDRAIIRKQFMKILPVRRVKPKEQAPAPAPKTLVERKVARFHKRHERKMKKPQGRTAASRRRRNTRRTG